MAYGTVKVDNVTFTYNSGDTSTTFSGLHASTTNNLTLSGTASAATFTGTTANFTNTNAQNISVTTLLSGLAITGGTAGFTTVTGTTVTGTTANFVTVSGTSITGGTAGFTTVTGTTVTGTTANFVTVSGTSITGGTAGFTTVTGTTVTGTTANFVTLSGTTVTGNIGQFTSLTGATTTMTSGVFALGTAPLPSISFVSDPNTGIYSPGADQVAVATNGTQRITVDADGRLLVGTASLISDNWTGNNESIQTAKSGLNSLSILAATAFTAAHSSYLALNRARGSLASPTIVANGDTLGSVYFSGYDGSSYLRSASIDCVAEGTIAATRIGSRLVFNTSTDAAPSVVTERMRITSGGLVGIGTSSPGGLFHVSGGRTLLSSSDGYELAFARVGNYFYFYNDGGNQTGKLSLTTTAGAGGGEIITFTQDTKRVGIGTTGPSQKLEIGGAGRSTVIVGSTNSFAELSLAGATTENYITSDDALAFYINTAERLRIDTSGRLLVGTTDGSGGVSKLVVQGASNGSAVGVAQISYNGLSSAVLAANTDIGYLRFTDQGSNSGVFAQITASTDGTTGAGDYPGRLVFSTTPDNGSSPTSSPPAMTIKSSQEVLIGTSTITANGGILQLKSGITFPATAVAASNPNTFDDYEEGTASTSIYGSTTNPIGLSFNATTYYTKIGRRVSFEWGANGATWSVSGTGDIYIEVPFICANLNNPTYQPMHGINIVHHDGFFNVTNVIAKIEQNSSNVYFYQTGSTTPLTWSNVVQSKFISMQLTYNTTT